MPNAILDPTGQTDRRAARAPAPLALARRPGGLQGARIGLLVNTKQNAAPFLAEVGRLLVEQHGAVSVMARTKAAFALPAPEGMLKELISECDVVITGVGDCGSCSASAVTDGITLEIRVVLAAFDALMRERAARGGGWQSTSGPAPLIVVNGPIRAELGFK
jgi:hypothetical protein